MINLLEESVRTAVKDTIAEQTRMDWSDSVFREHPKYYGDIEFKDSSIIGDNGVTSSKKYLAFRREPTKIGILSTDFSTNIDEKLASGRKAEYGSKVYTTSHIDTLNTPENGIINVLQFDPYNDNNLYCGDNNGTLSIYDIKNESNIRNVNKLSSSIYSIGSHVCSNSILAIGGRGNISIIDLNKNDNNVIINTKIMDETDNIIGMCYNTNGNYLQCITENKYLFTYDPRCDNEINNVIKLLYTPNNIINLYNDNQIIISGITSYLEPIIYAYDISGKLSANIFENYIFKQNYKYKQCKPMMKYDVISGIVYVAFQSCADILAINVNNKFEKEALYHSVSDTFMAFDILPKHSTKKREINKMIKFGKNRIQQIVHTRGGKLIHDFISSKPKQSIINSEEYFQDAKNISYDYFKLQGKCVSNDFLEEKKRSVSLYLHITGKEAQANYDKYFDLKISKTINCNLGLNIKINNKYALFPSPTYGGGALGIIKLTTPGRKKQSQLSAHAEKITTFDIGKNEYNINYVITGSPDCKAIINKINEKNDQISEIEKLYTFKCCGKVTFVSFHPRIRDICVIACNKEHSDIAIIYLYNYISGKLIRNIELENTKNINDIQFETIIGLIGAISCSNGIIKLFNILNGEIIFQFKSNTFARDTKLFWAIKNGQNNPKYYNQLICLGFGKGSVRKFTKYNLEHVINKFYNNSCNINIDIDNDTDEKKQENDNDNDNDNDEKKQDKELELELEPICTHSFGVSNAIPIGYYDGNDNLFYVSSIGDRKIRTFEFNKKGIQQMNASYQSQGDIQGIDFGSKQFINYKKVEMTKCFKMTKDGVIAPISFYIPRKRMEFFQDDLYSNILNVYDKNMLLDINIENNDKINVKLNYISLKPDDMELLSNAPKEKLTEHQKRRNSQIKLMEASKLKEQPQSTEQAFDQFSRMVADAPTANRWDAQNIGTEVAEDEWSD